LTIAGRQPLASNHGAGPALDAYADWLPEPATGFPGATTTSQVAEWICAKGGLFPGQIPEQPALPEVLDGNVINLEGHELRLISVGQSDTEPSTVVHVPDLDAVVGGDVCGC
jgi:hypothetical protein